MRDDFNKPTKELLAKRVAYRCSNPNCGKTTIGSNSDPKKFTNIGVAAHITAASPGGARYNSILKEDERKNFANGIWLCQNCASLVDRDEEAFTVQLLREWKSNAELDAMQRLNNGSNVAPTVKPAPRLEAELKLISTRKGPLGLSRMNLKKFGDDPIPIGEAIWINYLKWIYHLDIINNSDFTAFNVKVHFPKLKPSFSYLDNIGKRRAIKGLDSISLTGKYEPLFEGTGAEANRKIGEKFPIPIDKLEFIIECEDSLLNKYLTLCKLEGDEIENRVIEQIPKEYL